MVNYCVCAGCTNTNLSGHRVFRFPDKKRNGPVFRAWVQFVQVKRRDFTATSATGSAVVCDAHFRQKDYLPGDMMEFQMGFRSKERVRLAPGAVPSVHTVAPSAPPSAPPSAARAAPAGSGGSRRVSASRPKHKRSSGPLDHQELRGGASEKVSSVNGSWEIAGWMDDVQVVRIGDTQMAEEQCHSEGKWKDGGDGEEDLITPKKEEEEEEDNVFVIEYSNPEEDGESYKFTMSVDRSLPARGPVTRRPRRGRKQVREEEVLSNQSALELGQEDDGVTEAGADRRLVCTLCPPPGRLFKRGSGLAVHMKEIHQRVEKKTFFCTTCKQTLRSQVELDAHTKRHAHRDATFTCHLCSAESGPGFSGSRLGLKSHLQKEHPGVVPRCSICDKGFKSLASYLADQFRHVGRSPYYCAQCQIYEMTERGLSVHIRNHDRRRQWESQEVQPQTPGVADTSATDDSDF